MKNYQEIDRATDAPANIPMQEVWMTGAAGLDDRFRSPTCSQVMSVLQHIGPKDPQWR